MKMGTSMGKSIGTLMGKSNICGLRSSSTQHVQRTVAARDFATQWCFVIQSYTNAFWVKWKKHPLWLEALATSKKHICLKVLQWSFEKWQNLRMHFLENTKSTGHGWRARSGKCKIYTTGQGHPSCQSVSLHCGCFFLSFQNVFCENQHKLYEKRKANAFFPKSKMHPEMPGHLEHRTLVRP